MPETVYPVSEWSTSNTLALVALLVPACGVIWRLGQVAGAIQNLQSVLSDLKSSGELMRAGIADLRERVVVLERFTNR